jgi:hypothetical protein
MKWRALVVAEHNNFLGFFMPDVKIGVISFFLL